MSICSAIHCREAAESHYDAPCRAEQGHRLMPLIWESFWYYKRPQRLSSLTDRNRWSSSDLEKQR